MAKVTLKKLTWSNVRSFDGEHSISFNERGLVLLRGINHDTRGESAAGKSSLFMAIAFALDFSPYSAKDLKSWHNEDPMSVELELGTPSGPVVIHRGDKTWVKVGTDKPVTSAKAVKEAIDEALGVNKTLREALTFRRQRQPGMFLAKRDSEKKEFLVELLGLQWLEAEIDIQVKRVSAAEKQASAIQPLLTKANEDLAFAKQNHTPLVEVDIVDLEQVLAVWKDKLNSATAQLTDLISMRDSEQGRADADANLIYSEIVKGVAPLEEEILFLQSEEMVKSSCTEANRINRLRNEAKIRFEAAKKADRDRFCLWDAEVRGWQEAIRLIDRETALVPSLKANLVKLEEKLKILKAEECSECRRPWSLAEATVVAVEKQIERDFFEIVRLEKLYPSKEAYREKVKVASFEPDPKVSKLEKMIQDFGLQVATEDAKGDSALQVFKAEMAKKVSDTRVQISELNQDAGAKRAARLATYNDKWMLRLRDIEGLYLAKEDARTRHDGIVRDMAVASAQNVERQAAHQGQLASLKRSLESRNEAQEAVDKAESTHSVERDYLDLLRGFLGQIFEEILREISTEANKVIGAIPNTAGVTLKFSISRETLDGRLRNEITPIVTFDGHEAPLESSASGGQFTSIEIAVDLAVSKVIAQRTGCDLAWLFMDECFTGHTKVEKEACLETLKESARDRLIMVVDHSSETKESFTQTITVESRGGHSKITEIV